VGELVLNMNGKNGNGHSLESWVVILWFAFREERFTLCNKYVSKESVVSVYEQKRLIFTVQCVNWIHNISTLIIEADKVNCFFS
jgi:hypothetical protein